MLLSFLPDSKSLSIDIGVLVSLLIMLAVLVMGLNSALVGISSFGKGNCFLWMVVMALELRFFMWPMF